MPIEHKWTTKAGLDAIVYATDDGFRCGYVEVPKSNSLYKQNNCSDIVNILIVHGGVSFSGYFSEFKKQKNENFPLTGWWIGFDCDHYGDKSDSSITTNWEYHYFLSEFQESGTIKTKEYVIEECEQLAEQIREYDCFIDKWERKRNSG